MSSFHSADSSPNLYDEIQEMGDVSFLIYYLGYIKAASRKAKEENIEFKGMEVGENGITKKNGVISSSELSKTYTPSEIKTIIVDNLEYLQKLFPNEFNGDGLEQTYLSLDELEKGRISENVDLSNNVPERTTVDRYGSITSAFPNSSNKIDNSIGPKPSPPDCSENGIESHPCSANKFHTFSSKSFFDLIISSRL